jgi:hypothetical protein
MAQTEKAHHFRALHERSGTFHYLDQTITTAELNPFLRD